MASKISPLKVVIPLVLAATICLAESVSAQCYNVAVFITSGVVSKKRPKTVKAAIGAVVYTLRSGVVTIQEGSTVGYAAAKGKTVQAQSSGVATGLTVNGDITDVPKDVVISGIISYPATGGGTVPAVLTISSTGMKLESKKRGKKTFKVLTGKTAVQIVEIATGTVLYSQRPMSFAKTRAFRYQWQAVSCFSGGNGGVKR